MNETAKNTKDQWPFVVVQKAGASKLLDCSGPLLHNAR